MNPQPLAQRLPDYPTLKQWGTFGVPVDCGEHWTIEALTAAIDYGNHPSACTDKGADLINDEVKYQTDAGFGRVELLEDLLNNLPENTKVSPLALVPQANRRDRMIVNLSHPVWKNYRRGRKRQKSMLAPSVNESTVHLAPTDAVKKLGTAVPKIIAFLAYSPPDTDILLQKVDLSKPKSHITPPHHCPSHSRP